MNSIYGIDPHDNVLCTQTNHLENEYLDITICENGTLEILDKQSGLQYHQVLLFEDGGGDGDGYDYSPPINDTIVTSINCSPCISCTKNNLSEEAIIDFIMNIPLNLKERKTKKYSGTR